MNQPVAWTPRMILVAAPVVICGVLGLVLIAGIALALMAVGVRPIHADD